MLIKRFIRVKIIDSLKNGTYSETNDLTDFDIYEEFADLDQKDEFEHKFLAHFSF